MYNEIINIEIITPVEYKKISKSFIINYGFHPTIFGNCLIGITDKQICYLAFTDSNEPELEDIENEWRGATLVKDNAQSKDMIQRIFNSDKNLKEALSLLVKGTPFQIKVWKELVSIPFGGKVSYEDIASRIGNLKAVRAVGNSIAKNNISFLIPCHRVIKKSGQIHKYRWGSSRKVLMLEWEEKLGII